MKEKLDLRFIMYQIHNIHELVLKLHSENLNNEAYTLLLYEEEKYQYIKTNLTSNFIISQLYLDYSSTINTKLNDIEYAKNYFISKFKTTKTTLSKEIKIMLLLLQKKNISYFFKNIQSISIKNKKTLYYILKYIYKKINQYSNNDLLNKSDFIYLNLLCPFISQKEF